MSAVLNVIDLDTVNAMDRADFTAALGSTFEHADWVADQAWTARPFESVDALHAAMFAVVQSAPRDRQRAFLCGHPELAGKEAQARTMTDDSVAEQASAGPDALSHDEVLALRQLNAQYRERHGFPFIVAVRRHGKAQIFDMLRTRIAKDSETEVHEALAQIATITRLRLQAKLRG